MHELSIAQSLVDQVEDLARTHNANGVHLIRVRIGPLCGVVGELLATAFPMAAAGSLSENARLEWAESPVRVRCRTCHAESQAAANRLVCGQCGDWQTEVISGAELILESVELDIPDIETRLESP